MIVILVCDIYSYKFDIHSIKWPEFDVAISPDNHVYINMKSSVNLEIRFTELLY